MAQSIVRNDALASINNNASDAAAGSVDSTGEISITAITSSSASIFKEEDAAVPANAGPGVLPLTQRNGDAGNSTSTDGDYANMQGDEVGRMLSTNANSGRLLSFAVVSASDIINTTSTPIASAVPGYRYFVSAISCSNTSAASSRVDLLDGATVMWSGMLPTGSGGKGRVTAWFPVPLRGTTNTALNVQMATTAMAARCAASGIVSAN
jgi:hypothetical protein